MLTAQKESQSLRLALSAAWRLQDPGSNPGSGSVLAMGPLVSHCPSLGFGFLICKMDEDV